MSSIYVGRVNGRTLVRISGTVDSSTAARLAEALELLDGPFEIDCSQLDFIDEAGLEALYAVAESPGHLTLRNASQQLERDARMLGWSEALGISDPSPLRTTATADGNP